MLETKVVPERPVKNLDGYDHKLPTLSADVGSFATRADVVIVSHIDVKNLRSMQIKNINTGLNGEPKIKILPVPFPVAESL